MRTLRGFVPRPGLGRLAVLVLAAFAFVSCYDDYGLTTSDYDVVITYYDKAAKFAELSTYYMADTVFHALAEGEDDDITRKYDKDILALVAANLEGLGYTRILDTNATPKPTAIVGVTASNTTYVYWSYYPYYPYYGWGYYWYYPPYMTGGTYETGTLYINFSDARDVANDKLKVAWLGIGNGLAGATSSGSRITQAINQMFLQSPYLVID